MFIEARSDAFIALFRRGRSAPSTAWRRSVDRTGTCPSRAAFVIVTYELKMSPNWMIPRDEEQGEQDQRELDQALAADAGLVVGVTGGSDETHGRTDRPPGGVARSLRWPGPWRMARSSHPAPLRYGLEPDRPGPPHRRPNGPGPARFERACGITEPPVLDCQRARLRPRRPVSADGRPAGRDRAADVGLAGPPPPDPARRHRLRQDVDPGERHPGSPSRRSSSPTTRRSRPPSCTPSSASSSRTTPSSTSSATSTTTSPRRTCREATRTSRRIRRATTRSTGSATPRPMPCSSDGT